MIRSQFGTTRAHGGNRLILQRLRRIATDCEQARLSGGPLGDRLVERRVEGGKVFRDQWPLYRRHRSASLGAAGDRRWNGHDTLQRRVVDQLTLGHLEALAKLL